MTVINTNLASLSAQRSLSKTTDSLQQAMQRLASGLRVNSAKDDAAGLAISERMTAQIRGMTVAARNANDGISLAQTAEGAMDALGQTLQRMRDLAVQSKNGSNSTSDRVNLTTEYQQLQSELVRIIQSTTFNGKDILRTGGASGSAVVFQVGASVATNNTITLSLRNLSNASIGIGSVFVSATISAVATASKAITKINGAINKITTLRAKLGAAQNRFAVTIANLQNAIENQSAARSRIMDADFATETMNLSRAQILQQAGTAMLTQANQAPQTVLGLLR